MRRWTGCASLIIGGSTEYPMPPTPSVSSGEFNHLKGKLKHAPPLPPALPEPILEHGRAATGAKFAPFTSSRSTPWLDVITQRQSSQ